MKITLLSIIPIFLIIFVSCSDIKTEEKNKSTIDDFCSCATDLENIKIQIENSDDSEFEALSKVFSDKSQECKNIAEEMEKNNSNEELDKMFQEFEQNCPAANAFK